MGTARVGERPTKRRTAELATRGAPQVLNSLSIQRFRGLRDLELRDLAPVTIFTGRNGCGKTSVLEAAFLLCGLTNATLVFSLAAFRGVPAIAGSDTAFRVLLPNLEDGSKAAIRGTAGSGHGGAERSLEIAGITAPIGAGPTTEPVARLVGVEFVARSPSGERKGRVRWEPAPIGPNPPIFEVGPVRFEGLPGLRSEVPDNPDVLPARYVRPQPHAVMAELHGLLSELVKRMAIQGVLDILKLIAPTVTEVHPLVERGQLVIYVNVGANQLFPAQILGGGFINLLQLATFMCDDASRILLIDEIEGGLHYSVLPSLARTVIAFARERGKQFLIATHSLDVVSAFGEAGSESPNMVRFFKLYRRDSEIGAERFEVDAWRQLEEIGGEIR